MFNRVYILCIIILTTFASISYAETPSVTVEADNCEFSSVTQTSDYGWTTEAVTGKPTLNIITDCMVGSNAVTSEGNDQMGEWGTIVLKKFIDLSQAKAGDKLVFYVKQNVSSGIYININGRYRVFPTAMDEWNRVELDMDPAQWSFPSGMKDWSNSDRFAFYTKTFQSSKQYLSIDGLSFYIGGKWINGGGSVPDPWVSIPSGINTNIAVQTQDAWLLGNKPALWAISRNNGAVIGGWNIDTREQYLRQLDGNYYLEDSSSLLSASETKDVAISREFSPKKQQLTVVCTNADLPNTKITKTYKMFNNTLIRKISFASTFNKPKFVLYTAQARLFSNFRDEGTYVGASSFGPFDFASDISADKVPTYYVNPRGMILNNPVKGYSLAHYRSAVQGRFVFPWWSYNNRSESNRELFRYTSDGWKMPFSIDKLDVKGTLSYEENLSILAGNYHDFIVDEYPTRPDVQQAFKQTGQQLPGWLNEIKVAADDGNSGNINKLKRLAQTTDEGYILVLSGIGGANLGDYRVNISQVGLNGGKISGAAFKNWIQAVKAISPRMKVGIYTYMDSASYNSDILKNHPEWFRMMDKQGNEVIHFTPGLSPNYTTMYNNPACRKAITDQFDLMFSYLGADFVYLDDALTNNLVKWDTNEVLRDYDSEQLWREIRAVAAKYGPDKAVFFNGQGNPYGDINFIEAYSRLSAGAWRLFAGVGTGVETFLTNRPQSRVIPLYWVSDLGREYVNRVLAMGWVPQFYAGDELETRPFISAAYEIGNANPVNANYTPDWRKSKTSNIESFCVRRLEDTGGAIFSFISREAAAGNTHVQIDTDKLGLDTGKPLYIWQYDIKDANTYKGIVTESASKSIYSGTGWSLDKITTPKLVYSGNYIGQIALDLDLSPNQMSMIMINNDAGNVVSENNLPCNFLFANSKNVSITSQLQESIGELLMKVKSSRQMCEVVGLVPIGWKVNQILIDNTKVTPNWMHLGGAIYPLLSIPSGNHTIRIQCTKTSMPALNISDMEVKLVGKNVEVRLPSITSGAKAILTLEKDGLVYFNQAVARNGDIYSIPIAPQGGGTYQLAVRSLMSDTLQSVTGAEAKIDLPVVSPSLTITGRSAGLVPGSNVIKAVNKKINGYQVLNSAIETSATEYTIIAPNMSGVTAKVNPADLSIHVGTTQKIAGFLGTAFAGYEIKGAQQVSISLSNTFYDAFNFPGKQIHSDPYHPNTFEFAGLMVDYHTTAGYTKRVAFGVGFMHPELAAISPGYGKGTVPDQLVDLGQMLNDPSNSFSLNLATYAPTDWDGQVWFSAGTSWVCPGRTLTVKILALSKSKGITTLKGTDPKELQKVFTAKRQILVPKTETAPIIDGKADDKIWASAGVVKEFFLVGGKGYPSQKTTAYMLYDNNCLYIKFVCQENVRKKPISDKANVWANDEVEVYIDVGKTVKTFKQILASSGGDNIAFSNGKVVPMNAKVGFSVVEKDHWTVEMAIPFETLGKKPSSGEVWGLNLARYRPEGNGFVPECITWSPTLAGLGNDEVARFSDMIFE